MILCSSNLKLLTMKKVALLPLISALSAMFFVQVVSATVVDTVVSNCKADFSLQFSDNSKTAMQFKNLSTGENLQYYWSFGDSSFSNLPDPLIKLSDFYPVAFEFIESSNQTFKTCLTVKNEACKNEICKYFRVGDSIVPDNLCYAWIDYAMIISPYSSFIPYQLYGKSYNNVLSWHWTYSDTDSYLQNPVINLRPLWNERYSAYGTEVLLEILTEDSCTYTARKFIPWPSPAKCDVSFNYYMNDSVSTDSLMYIFKGISADTVISWKWDFGDGTTSNEQNPIHYYDNMRDWNLLKCGFKKCIVLYNVCLTIETTSGCTNTYCHEIVPGQPPYKDCKAYFTYNIGESYPPTYMFTNNSDWSGGSVYWDFGDGFTSTENNPKHVFKSYSYPKDSFVYIDSSMIMPPYNGKIYNDYHYVCMTIYDQYGCSSSYCETIITQPDSSIFICENSIKLTTSFVADADNCNGSAEASLVDKNYNQVLAAQFYWSTGDVAQTVNNLCTNTVYYITAVDSNGCKASSSFVIYDQNPTWKYYGDFYYKEYNNYYEFRYNPKSIDYNINWVFSNGDTLKGSLAYFDGLQNESKWVDLIVTDKEGNVLLTQRKELGTTSVPEKEAKQVIEVYPTLAKDYINISSDVALDNASVQLFDISGRIVLKEIISGSKETISLKSLKSGAYLCRIMFNANNVFDGKIIKQ